MNALLHYAFLKGLRDRSLPIFFLLMPVQIAATMIAGGLMIRRRLRYPVIELSTFDANDVMIFSFVVPWMVATLSAFWTFRSEVATRAISSFVIGSRPLSVVLALVAFAATTATAGLIAAAAMAALLLGTIPPFLASTVWVGTLFSIMGASLGALLVTISPQPAVLVWSIVVMFPLASRIVAKTPSLQAASTALVAAAAIAVSTFLLRRRCAS